jgi:hypothetical protein
LEALQGDPTRRDSLIWITSYASLFHKPGVPLYDLMAIGKAGTDPRMLFSWYAADLCTDVEWDRLAASPEIRANPSYESWAEGLDYLIQQQGRLPSHMFRRLHLCLPGLPEGTAYQLEAIEDSIARGVRVRPYAQALHGRYVAFVDMAGGSRDDSTVGIAHLGDDGSSVLDYVGATFMHVFSNYGISSELSLSSASELYSAFEPRLNSHQVTLLDHPVLEQQLLGMTWKGGKIDHPSGEHDDIANSAVGALLLALDQPGDSSEEPLDDHDEDIVASEMGTDNFLRGW